MCSAGLLRTQDNQYINFACALRVPRVGPNALARSAAASQALAAEDVWVLRSSFVLFSWAGGRREVIHGVRREQLENTRVTLGQRRPRARLDEAGSSEFNGSVERAGFIYDLHMCNKGATRARHGKKLLDNKENGSGGRRPFWRPAASGRRGCGRADGQAGCNTARLGGDGAAASHLRACRPLMRRCVGSSRRSCKLQATAQAGSQ